MKKRVITFIIALFIMFVSVICNNSFFVFADYDGSYYYVPDNSLTAYYALTNYGFSFDIDSHTLSSSTIRSSSFTITEGSYNITPNFNSMYNTNNVSSSSTAHLTYFGNGLSTGSFTTQSDPKLTVSSHNYNFSAIPFTESNYLNSYASYHNLTGVPNTYSSYVNTNGFYIRGNDTLVFSFVCSTLPNMGTVFSQDSSINVSVSRTASRIVGNGNEFGNQFVKLVYVFTNSSSSGGWFTFNAFPNITSSINVIPVFFGYTNEMTDDTRHILGLETELESLLKVNNTLTTSINNRINSVLTYQKSGDSTTSTRVGYNSDSNSSFNTSSNSYHSLETNQLNDTSTKLGNIDTSNALYSNNGFLSAVNFVKAVFQNLISYDSSNALRLMITFSLVLGVALTVIGKLRN